jgi:hypothetical protein
MAQFIKHVGVNGQGKKCVVVFRELPGDSDSALVVPTEALPTLYHDDLIAAIENVNCQKDLDPSDYLFRQSFHDGTNMLNTMHQRGWLVKVPTKSIVMTPKPGVEINLVELNKQLKQISNEQAAQSGSTRSSDIASNTPAKPEPTPPGIISDEQLASRYRRQAAQFKAEAERLLKEAEELDPKGAAVVAPVSPSLSVVPQQEGQQNVPVKRGRGRPPKAQTV